MIVRKIVTIILIQLILIFGIINISFAENEPNVTPTNSGITKQEKEDQTIDQTIQGAKNFISNANTSNTINAKGLKEGVDIIYNIFLACGMVVAVAGGVALGIKFMTGSISSKAEVKESLTPYIIGCVIIFGAYGIWKIVITFMQNFN